ncbi:MAG: GGDEF domain-containing protein, partial [Epsilonproteobacteria bacterium]|nr:GGDEF domain-containing protein [Campylobacterota bacterium]
SEIAQKIELLEAENIQLKLETEVLIEKSVKDPLTGLYNRFKIEEIFLKEQQRFTQCADPLSIILMDLDYFKEINDSYGHNVGDEYLKELSKILINFFRKGDIVGRWGGEEFLILIPRCTANKAKKVATRLKDMISEIDYPIIGRRTASFGLATLHKKDTLASIVNRADKALFLAKKSGRNKIIMCNSA